MGGAAPTCGCEAECERSIRFANGWDLSTQPISYLEAVEGVRSFSFVRETTVLCVSSWASSRCHPPLSGSGRAPPIGATRAPVSIASSCWRGSIGADVACVTLLARARHTSCASAVEARPLPPGKGGFMHRVLGRSAELHTRAGILRSRLTPSEALLWGAISRGALGVWFKRQVVLGRYIVDFAAPQARLVVEVDGGYHSRRRAADARRDRALRRMGYRVVRVSAELVIGDLAQVVDLIRAAVGVTRAARQRPR